MYQVHVECTSLEYTSYVYCTTMLLLHTTLATRRGLSTEDGFQHFKQTPVPTSRAIVTLNCRPVHCVRALRNSCDFFVSFCRKRTCHHFGPVSRHVHIIGTQQSETNGTIGTHDLTLTSRHTSRTVSFCVARPMKQITLS